MLDGGWKALATKRGPQRTCTYGSVLGLLKNAMPNPRLLPKHWYGSKCPRQNVMFSRACEGPPALGRCRGCIVGPAADGTGKFCLSLVFSPSLLMLPKYD